MLVVFFSIFKSSIWQEGLLKASFVVHLYSCTIKKRFVQFRTNQWFDLFLKTLIKKSIAVTWQFKCVTQGAGNPNQIRWRWSLVWKTPAASKLKYACHWRGTSPLSWAFWLPSSSLILSSGVSLLLSLSLSLPLLTSLSLSLLTSLSLHLLPSLSLSSFCQAMCLLLFAFFNCRWTGNIVHSCWYACNFEILRTLQNNLIPLQLSFLAPQVLS